MANNKKTQDKFINNTQTILPSSRDCLSFSIMGMRTVSQLCFGLNTEINEVMTLPKYAHLIHHLSLKYLGQYPHSLIVT